MCFAFGVGFIGQCSRFQFFPSFHCSFPEETVFPFTPAGEKSAQSPRTYAQVAGASPSSGARPRRQVRVPERYREAAGELQRRRHVSSSSSRRRPEPQTARQAVLPGPSSAPASLAAPSSPGEPAANELAPRSEQRRAVKKASAREKEKRAKK